MPATPRAGRNAYHSGENPGQMTLVGEPASDRDLCNRFLWPGQHLFGGLHALPQKPTMRRFSDRLFERSAEMAHGQPAFVR
jgi:hypothetical protein